MMKKYFETFLVPAKFDSLGNIRHAESDQLDRFFDAITGFPYPPPSTFYKDNFWNNPKFINVPPFFNNTLIADKFRVPGSNVLVDYVYFHPDFAFLRNFTKKSDLQQILTTSSFRSLQDKPNFFETQINSISINPDRLTTGRFIGEFINKFFLAPPPPRPILPSKLTASVLADNAYLRAMSNSINNSPFAIVSFDEFFYLLSGFDKTAQYQFSQYQISNLDYYKTLLKINYIFHSHRQFKHVNSSDFAVQPIHLWYENLFLTYISRLLDFYFFTQIIPLHHRNIKRTFPTHKTKSQNSLSTELYPIYELPQSFINSFQYISSPIYANPTITFDISSFQKKVPVFFNFPNYFSHKSKPNFFNLNFSQIFFYSWDFKSNRLVDNRTKFQKVSNYTETKNFKVSKELPSYVQQTNLEGDDLDRFFFLAYKNAKLSTFERLPDSSTLLYNTLRWSTFESPNFRIYKNFTSIQSDFLNTFEFAFPFNQTSEAQLFNFYANRPLPPTSPPFLRRYRHPFTAISHRPHLRSIFQPSPRYKRFISFKNKFKKNHHNYPRSRRKKSSLFKDQSFIGNQNDVYFYFFDPTISFNKEYSNYFLPKKSFKIANENFFDHVYTRRRLPFRKKYKLFDRIEKKDFVFKSRIRGHKANPASKHVRLRTRKIYRYRHLKTDLFNKQSDHIDGYYSRDPKIDVGWMWQSGYLAWSYPLRYLVVATQGLFGGLIYGPYRFFRGLLFTHDGFLTVATYAGVFYFFDYMLLTIYVYFPGLLFFFDYTFFSFHFHVFHFWVMLFSIIFATVGGYFLLTSSDFPKKFTFFQFFPFVFFYFAIETLFLLLGILFFTFTVITEKAIKIFFFVLFSFFLCLFGLNFFINFFLSFSRYNYIPSSHFFFNYPFWFQRFGCYKSNYYFQIWPSRFNFFKLFSDCVVFPSISKNFFKKSFFYIYTGNMKKRYFYNKKNFFHVYDLKNLDFPVPVFGPNIFSSYSYYQDKLNQIPLRLSPWDSNQDETVIENDLDYQMSNLHDETDSALITKQSYVIANKFAIHVTEDEHDNIEAEAEADPDNPEPPSEDFLTESDLFVNTSELSGPNLKDQDLDNLDDPSFFSGKVNKAFFNKQKKPMEVSDVFIESEIEDIFDYERASHYEIYERDTLDRTFTSENSLGYWYAFQMSKSNKRVLPPTLMLLHSRPLDPLFTTNLLFPFLFSLKSYSNFENFPQFKFYSMQKCFRIFQTSLDSSYFKNSFWCVQVLVAILFFPIQLFFSVFSFLKRCFIKKHLFKKAFKKARYFYFYYSFRKTFYFNLRFNVSFSAFLTYSFFYFFFSFLNLFYSSKFISLSRQFSKSFMLFYIFKNFKFLYIFFH
jgi:hypothetical protein